MPSWSVTSEKVMFVVPEEGGATQQVACSTLIELPSRLPSCDKAAPAIGKDRPITIMPAASRRSIRLSGFALIPTHLLLPKPIEVSYAPYPHPFLRWGEVER